MQLGTQVNGLGFAPGKPWQAAGADGNYHHASFLLDRGQYEEAAAAFDRVQTGANADGALCWKAHRLNKWGRRDEARANDPSEKVRKEIAFALSPSKEPVAEGRERNRAD